MFGLTVPLSLEALRDGMAGMRASVVEGDSLSIDMAAAMSPQAMGFGLLIVGDAQAGERGQATQADCDRGRWTLQEQRPSRRIPKKWRQWACTPSDRPSLAGDHLPQPFHASETFLQVRPSSYP